MSGIDIKGSLYFNDPYGKYGQNVFYKNGFVDNHDIKVDTQVKNGKPTALTVQIANPGALALDKDTFEKRKEPSAYIKCDYNKYPVNHIFDMVKNVIGIFDRHKKEGYRQYFAMYGGFRNNIPKEYYEDAEYYDDAKYGRVWD